MKQVNRSEVRINNEEGSPDSPTGNFKPETNGDLFRNRVAGLLLLLGLFGAYWLYGWGGEIRLSMSNSQPVNWTSQSIYAKLIVLSAVFTVVGYGLLLAYYKHMSAVALLLSLFIVSFTVIISPLISKFWFNVFMSDFQGSAFFSDNSPVRFLRRSFGELYIYVDFYNLKVAFANSISQLVMLLGVFGKLSAVHVVVNTILYNITWNLCHFLCILLEINSPDTRIFDDYQINNVYLFAACYALVLSLIMKSHPKKSLSHSSQSIVLALTGTFFVFLSFCATSTLFPLKFTPGQAEYSRSYIWQEGFISIFFALSGSVVFACACSALFGGKMGLHECVFGTITGGVIYGAVAGTSVNVGAAIASGLFSGLLSALIYRFAMRKLNSGQLRDSYAASNTLLVSFFGTFVIAPSILIAYYNRWWVLTTLQVSNFDKVGLPLVNASIVGWILSYVGISMGIGMVSGGLSGALLRLFPGELKAHNMDFFTLHYGLTPNNPEIFEEDYSITTKYERILKLLQNKKADKKSVLNVIEVTKMKRNGDQLLGNQKQTIDVQLHGVQQTQFQIIEKEVKSIAPRALVSKGEGEIMHAEGVIHNDSIQHFKTIYYLLKSRKLHQTLSSSSLQELKVETSQRSFAGMEDRHVSMRGTFERQDHGVQYLNFLKSNYPELSMQTTIKN